MGIRRSLTLFLYVFFIGTGCATNITNLRLIPKYNGVEREIVPFVDMYLDLAKYKGLKFKHKVTVGFAEIHQGRAVGLTYRRLFFREIDVDVNYWKKATSVTKMNLAFHELTHAYCGRDHDFGDGEKYDESHFSFEGRFEDDCPVSFMYPTLLNDSCTLKHFNEYVEEMFKRCREW